MASITVAFDAGTSGTKIIASYPSLGKCVFNDENYFLVKPYVRQLTEDTYNDLLEYAEGQIGLNSSLVSYVNPSTKEKVYWEVGESARRLGLLSVQQRKFETFVVKVLSFLGYLVNSRVRKSEQISLILGILLPLDEIEDRALLAKWLRQVISEQGFSVNGYPITNIVVDKIYCKPEGYGIYKSYPTERAGILIIGHSDLSWLYFNQGLFSTELSRTFPGSGMHSFVRNLRFPIQDECQSAEIIAQAGVKLEAKILATLTQTKTNDEIALLVKAIKLAHSQYWKERINELQFLKITLAESISVAGGAANYFSLKLNEIFKQRYGLNLNWCKSLRREFCQNFALKTTDKSIPLFLDCYGYYKTLIEPSQNLKRRLNAKETILGVSKNASN